MPKTKTPTPENISLRDWFAGQALVGMLSSNRYKHSQDAAKDAYTLADAMLKVRCNQ